MRAPNLYDELLRVQREAFEAEEREADSAYSTKRFTPQLPPRRPFFAPGPRRLRREFASNEERATAREQLIRRGLQWVLK